MSMQAGYEYHIDPGHGWVAVPYKELVELGIEDKISYCSYRYEGMCYLEEDCDFAVWENAFSKRHGFAPEIIHVYHDGVNDPECFIHELPLYWYDNE